MLGKKGDDSAMDGDELGTDGKRKRGGKEAAKEVLSRSIDRSIDRSDREIVDLEIVDVESDRSRDRRSRDRSVERCACDTTRMVCPSFPCANAARHANETNNDDFQLLNLGHLRSDAHQRPR